MSKKVLAKDIAIVIADQGFEAAAKKFEITPQKARDVIEAMKGVNAKVPDELKALADKIRNYGHKQDRAEVGDERDYVCMKNGRISADARAIGIKPGQLGRVRYEPDQIVITKPKAKVK